LAAATEIGRIRPDFGQQLTQQCFDPTMHLAPEPIDRIASAMIIIETLARRSAEAMRVDA
jgi:hypothetical protein